MKTNTVVSEDETADSSKEFLTLFIADQQFGIPILQVQDVIKEQNITKIPLSPPEIAGSLNLRGRVVTVVNVKERLGIKKSTREISGAGIVVEYDHELYSLIIDQIGDVLKLDNHNLETNLATLDPQWRNISSGIYRLEKNLLVIIDVSKLLNTVHEHES